MTLRQRLIVWANDRTWAKRIYVWLADRHNRKLAKTEFDKVNGSGLGVLRRDDGSIVASPGRSVAPSPGQPIRFPYKDK